MINRILLLRVNFRMSTEEGTPTESNGKTQDTATVEPVDEQDVLDPKFASLQTHQAAEQISDQSPVSRTPKRKFDDPSAMVGDENIESYPSYKKPKLGEWPLAGNYSQDNALSRLNKLVPGLVYQDRSRTGPPHRPTFTVDVLVHGHVRLSHLSMIIEFIFGLTLSFSGMST